MEAPAIGRGAMLRRHPATTAMRNTTTRPAFMLSHPTCAVRRASGRNRQTTPDRCVVVHAGFQHPKVKTWLMTGIQTKLIIRSPNGAIRWYGSTSNNVGQSTGAGGHLGRPIEGRPYSPTKARKSHRGGHPRRVGVDGKGRGGKRDTIRHAAILGVQPLHPFVPCQPSRQRCHAELQQRKVSAPPSNDA